MKASTIMTVNVTVIDSDTPISYASKLMKTLSVRHLPVVRGGELLGIVSDRDLLKHATHRMDGEWVLPDLCASEAMTFRPISARASSTVAEVARLMIDNHIDSVPITDAHHHLKGLVTSTDLLRLLVEPNGDSNVLPFTFNVREADRTGTA